LADKLNLECILFSWATDNAILEEGEQEMQGWKMQDWNIRENKYFSILGKISACVGILCAILVLYLSELLIRRII